MKKQILLAGLSLALAFAGAVPAALSQETSAPPTAASAVRGQPAPDIQVREWIGGDGRQSLADFRGDVVVIEFWKTH